MPEKPNLFKPETWEHFPDVVKVRLYALREMFEAQEEFTNEFEWDGDY